MSEIGHFLSKKIEEVRLFRVDGKTYFSKSLAVQAVLDERLTSSLLDSLRNHNALAGSGIHYSQIEPVIEKIAKNTQLRMELRQIFIQDIDIDGALHLDSEENEPSVSSSVIAVSAEAAQTEEEPRPVEVKENPTIGKELENNVDHSLDTAPHAEATVHTPTQVEAKDETKDGIPEDVRLGNDDASKTGSSRRTRANKRG